jgi:spore maturation protein CgeB
MRILFVGAEWDYGDPRRGHSFEFDTFLQTLQRDGHDTTLLDVGAFRNSPKNEVETAVRSSVHSNQPDVVFCFLFEQEIPPEVLATVRDKDGLPVVNWFADDHWRYDNFSRLYAPALTLSVTTSSRAAARYAADGYPHLFSQWGYADKVYGSPTPVAEPDQSIVFVGQPYGDRAKALDKLAASLPGTTTVEIYGHGTANGRITPVRMIELFNRSAGSVNFSSSWQPGLRSRLKRRQLRRRTVPPQLKARVFEVTGAGGLLITQPSEDLPLYFKKDEEIVIFESDSELADAAGEAVTNAEWRHRLSSAGAARCLGQHTMTHRLNDVFRAIGR